MLDDASDRTRIEVGPVGQDDHGVCHRVAQRGETAPKRCTRSELPVRTAHDRHSRTWFMTERVRPFDHDNAVKPADREPLQHRRQKLPLLGPPVAGRGSRGQDDRADHEGRIVMLRTTIRFVGCSCALPNVPILSTTASPEVTWPITA